MNKRNLLCVGAVTVCFALVTGCKLPTSQPRQAFDYEAVIKRVQQEFENERQDMDNIERQMGHPLRKEMAFAERNLYNYLLLLKQCQNSQRFEPSEQEDPVLGSGVTLLMYGSMSGHCDVVKDLLAAGADVNEKSTNNRTALFYAAGSHHLDVVNELLAAGADTEIKDESGWTALMAALLVCQCCRVDDKYFDTVKTLLCAGADTNARDQLGYSALDFSSDPHLISLLISAGAHVNAQDSEGKTALMKAVRSDYGTVRTLLFEKANVNIKDKSGRTALMYAVQDEKDYGYLSVIELLLSFGADVNAKDNEGTTALSLAKKPAAIALLCEAGAKE